MVSNGSMLIWSGKAQGRCGAQAQCSKGFGARRPTAEQSGRALEWRGRRSWRERVTNHCSHPSEKCVSGVVQNEKPGTRVRSGASSDTCLTPS